MRDKSNYNQYMRSYVLDRYKTLREAAIEKYGGCCVECSSMDRLEFDHIDPKTKEFSIGKLWSLSQDKIDKELQKCQLLCKGCHDKKSILERGQKIAKGFHGTRSSYRYCKCAACKAAQSEYMKKYREGA